MHLTAHVPAATTAYDLADHVLRDVLAQALDGWTGLHGRPRRGTVLSVLWCGPGDYPPAHDAPHLSGREPEVGTSRDVDVVVTDDLEARDHPLVWCEVESADGR